MRIKLTLICLVSLLTVASAIGMMVGGYGEEKPAMEEEQRICDVLKGQMETSVGVHCSSNCLAWEKVCSAFPFRNFGVVSYRSQVVAGTNFIFKIQIGDDSFIAAKVFRPLPYTGAPPELKGVAPYNGGQLDPNMFH